MKLILLFVCSTVASEISQAIGLFFKNAWCDIGTIYNFESIACEKSEPGLVTLIPTT